MTMGFLVEDCLGYRIRYCYYYKMVIDDDILKQYEGEFVLLFGLIIRF